MFCMNKTELAWKTCPVICFSFCVDVDVVFQVAYMFKTHFTKDGLAHIQSLVKVIFALNRILMVQLGNKFAHVMTAQPSWQIQNCYQIWSHILFEHNMNVYKIRMMAS